MITNNMVIIGCGWLAKPLAIELINNGYQVTLTSRTPNKCQQSPSPAIVHLDTDNLERARSTLVDLAPSVMIIAIPPTKNAAYQQALQHLIRLAADSSVKRVIFISSTSVWGKNTGVITESTPALPQTKSAIAMLACSETLQGQDAFQSTTLYLSGLFNQARHPGRFLAGKSQIKHPNGSVNMIHLQDCIGLIKQLLTQATWQASYIGCANDHPKRKTFYHQASTALGLVPPRFDCNDASDDKIIDGTQTAQQLGYRYQYPLLVDGLDKP